MSLLLFLLLLFSAPSFSTNRTAPAWSWSCSAITARRLLLLLLPGPHRARWPRQRRIELVANVKVATVAAIKTCWLSSVSQGREAAEAALWSSPSAMVRREGACPQ